jgi:hypothetical protein
MSSYQEHIQDLNKTKRILIDLVGPVPDLENLPPLSVLVEKTNTAQSEGRLVSEIVANEDYMSIINCELNWLPDPRAIISGRYKRESKVVTSIVNKVISYIKKYGNELQRNVPY